MATDKQIEDCINSAFVMYPKFTRDSLLRVVMHELDSKYSAALPYGTVSQHVMEYIDAACADGKLMKVQGKAGGIFRYIPYEKLIELDKEVMKLACFELPCKQCSRKNTVGDSKCWWCECPNPTSK
jgi:hypothetical protein